MYCFALEFFKVYTYWFEYNSALPQPEGIFPLISIDHARQVMKLNDGNEVMKIIIFC